MKLVCDSCGTKYSISDDKVAGRAFKIRCKTCDHVIVLRGPTPAVVGEWYAVIDGDQSGPLTRDALDAMPSDTLVWREGMPEWTALAALDAKPAPEAPKLVGERNENSQLFSLGTLASMARSPAPKQPASAAAIESREGSGLLDIRSLAATIAPKPVTSSVPDLPVAAPVGFGAPIVLVPMRKTGFDRRLVGALVATLSLLAAIAVVLLVVITREPEEPRATAQVASTQANALAASSPTAPVPIPVPVPAANPNPNANPNQDTRKPAPTASTPSASRAPTTRTTTARTTTTTRTRTTTPTLPSLTPKREECNEVTCAVNGYADACCAIYKSGGIPEKLDKNLIAKGLASINARVCNGPGEVSLSLTISPAGTVAGVSHRGQGDTPLAACVAAAAKRGSFPRTHRGGSFGYIWRL